MPVSADIMDLIPDAINAAREVIAAAAAAGPSVPTDDVDTMASSVFEMLDDVVELWTPKIREMFPLMLTFGLEEALRSSPHGTEISAARESATEFVATCLVMRPKAVKKAKMVDACIEAAYQLTCESEQGVYDKKTDTTNAFLPPKNQLSFSRL